MVRQVSVSREWTLNYLMMILPETKVYHQLLSLTAASTNEELICFCFLFSLNTPVGSADYHIHNVVVVMKMIISL